MSVITKVQKLLTLAMDEGATPAERQRAQEKADQLMVEHMIEQSDLKAEDPDRSRVTSEEWQIDLSRGFRQDIEDMFWTVLNHAKCRYSHQTKYNRETGSVEVKTTVVGMPEQIAYAERLWFIVFSEMVGNLHPKWNKDLPFDTNVYNFVKAGIKWQQIHEIAFEQEGFESGLPEPYPARLQSKYGFKKVWGKDGGRLKRAYNREQKRLGEEVRNHTQRHGAYRNSYIKSFSSTIRHRLTEIALKSKQNLTVDDRDKFSLAVQSTQAQTDAEFYRLFPEYDPNNEERLARDQAWREKEEARLAGMSEEERQAEKEKKRKQQERARKQYDEMMKKNYDSNGWSRGTAVAQKVNLNNSDEIKHSRVAIN